MIHILFNVELVRLDLPEFAKLLCFQNLGIPKLDLADFHVFRYLTSLDREFDFVVRRDRDSIFRTGNSVTTDIAISLVFPLSTATHKNMEAIIFLEDTARDVVVVRHPVVAVGNGHIHIDVTGSLSCGFGNRGGAETRISTGGGPPITTRATGRERAQRIVFKVDYIAEVYLIDFKVLVSRAGLDRVYTRIPTILFAPIVCGATI
jgi:hypothetical protein